MTSEYGDFLNKDAVTTCSRELVFWPFKGSFEFIMRPFSCKKMGVA